MGADEQTDRQTEGPARPTVFRHPARRKETRIGRGKAYESDQRGGGGKGPDIKPAVAGGCSVATRRHGNTIRVPFLGGGRERGEKREKE